jgi:hypothetical protein
MDRSDNTGSPASPELAHLFGAYLYQSWTAEYDDVWDAVRDFCSDESPEGIRRTADQVRELLDSEPDETALKSATDALHLYYYPPGVGQTYRDWLGELEVFLRAQADVRR